MIRFAAAHDLPAIVDIYNAAVLGRSSTADLEPVSVDERRAWFDAHSPERHPLWVFERDGKVAGWLGLSAYQGRAAYAATSEVSVYVARDHRRQGIARSLLEQAMDRAPTLGLRTLLGFIFAHNVASVALFHGFGFQDWGCLPQATEVDGIRRDVLIVGRHVG